MFPACVDIQGQSPGKTLLVTAGMDGDEYAGIEAARQLSTEFIRGDFQGRLIIIPIMNMAGFETGVSFNPIDKKFPKNIFPGKAHGSASEQLIHWLTTTYIDHADVWIDLHGGAKDEELIPFLWTFKTRIQEVDTFIKNFHSIVTADIIVFERARFFSKPKRLARRGCPYIMSESGQLGERDPDDIARHILWVKQLMKMMRMIEFTSKQEKNPKMRTSAHGLWWKKIL